MSLKKKMKKEKTMLKKYNRSNLIYGRKKKTVYNNESELNNEQL